MRIYEAVIKERPLSPYVSGAVGGRYEKNN